MSGKDVSKDVLNLVNSKVGKNVSQKDIQKLAGGVGPSTVNNEAQLRQLIKSVSKMVNVKVSDDTVHEIVQAIKSSGMNPNNMEQIMKMMMKK
jgi:uncharacterized protein YpuA (DUF1002 family)